MKKLNNFAQVHLKIVAVVLAIVCLAIIPRVLAMSMGDSLVIQPYGWFAMLAALVAGVMRLLRDGYRPFKRIFDIVVSCLALVISAPVLALCAIVIKLFSPSGPVIYSQIRMGKNGRLFTIYKLRSMRPDAEHLSGAVWANAEKDPREIPFLGNFLRKSHLDEIPQFFNVIKGDMSIVGPRPERPEMVDKLTAAIPEYRKRLQVKPGITGLAQVWNRYDKTLRDVRKKVKLDLLYIRKACMSCELQIMFLTLVVMLKGRIIKRKRRPRVGRVHTGVLQPSA